MTDKTMKKRLAEALAKTAPNDINGVLSRCKERKETKITEITKRHSRKWIGAVAACLAVLFLGGGGIILRQAVAVTSVVSLDVNPSMELRVDRSERVVSCTPLNDDAKTVLADMGGGEDLKHAKLDVAVNAIVGSLLRNGYLNSLSSAIMISVEDKDQTRAEKLRRELNTTVDSILQTGESKAAVLTQTVEQNAALAQQAHENRISTGKAALINRVLAKNSALEFAKLAALSVGELKDLAEIGAPAMPIGAKKAMEIAVAAYQKTSPVKLLSQEADAELDDVPAHYEVELKNERYEEYEYKIDAFTGAVLAVERETEEDVPPVSRPTGQTAVTQPSSPPAKTGDIGYAGAMAAALKRAGLQETQVRDVDIEPDDEDGRPVYEVEFTCGDREYTCVIDAATGAVLEYETEQDD